jgi:hypothetical protein
MQPMNTSFDRTTTDASQACSRADGKLASWRSRHSPGSCDRAMPGRVTVNSAEAHIACCARGWRTES